MEDAACEAKLNINRAMRSKKPFEYASGEETSSSLLPSVIHHSPPEAGSNNTSTSDTSLPQQCVGDCDDEEPLKAWEDGRFDAPAALP